MGPTWDPPGSCRPQMGPMLAHEPCDQGRSHNLLIITMRNVIPWNGVYIVKCTNNTWTEYIKITLCISQLDINVIDYSKYCMIPFGHVEGNHYSDLDRWKWKLYWLPNAHVLVENNIWYKSPLFHKFYSTSSYPYTLIKQGVFATFWQHITDVIISAMASQTISPTSVYATVCSGADQRKHQSSALLAFVTGELPAQMASNAENVSIGRRHHEFHLE